MYLLLINIVQVLIMDRITVKVMSCSCKMADITDEGISCKHLQISLIIWTLYKYVFILFWLFLSFALEFSFKLVLLCFPYCDIFQYRLQSENDFFCIFGLPIFKVTKSSLNAKDNLQILSIDAPVFEGGLSLVLMQF